MFKQTYLLRSRLQASRSTIGIHHHHQQLRFSSRLSATELRDKLKSASTANANVELNIVTKSEQTQSGLNEIYTIKGSDLQKALAAKTSSNADAAAIEDTRFQYAPGRVDVYINSSRTSGLVAELRKYAKVDKSSGKESLEKEFTDEYGAGNKEMSKGTNTSQPTNL